MTHARRLWPAVLMSGVALLAGVGAWTGAVPGVFSGAPVSSNGDVQCTSGVLAPGTYRDVKDNNGSTTVTGNTIGHNAKCEKNASFTGGGNTAGGQDTCN